VSLICVADRCQIAVVMLYEIVLCKLLFDFYASADIVCVCEGMWSACRLGFSKRIDFSQLHIPCLAFCQVPATLCSNAQAADCSWYVDSMTVYVVRALNCSLTSWYQCVHRLDWSSENLGLPV